MSGQAVKSNDPQLNKIDVIEQYGASLPTGLTFQDSNGETFPLDRVFHQDKPVILTLNYFECPMLCTYELNGLGEGLSKTRFIPGSDVELVTVSIDPRETPDLAAQKRDTYLSSYFEDHPEADWHFLTGDQETITQLADAVGFQYYYDSKNQEYAHPAAVVILTADGVISRYLYGIQYKPRDLRLALTEAAEGTIGNTIDRILLYCFHYDPNANSYVLMASNVMRLGGGITVLVMGLVFGLLWRREYRKKHVNMGKSHS